MSRGGYAARLADGRLHLQHGPIDLLVGIDAPDAVREGAERRAMERFDPLLARLALRRGELSTPAGTDHRQAAAPSAAPSADPSAAPSADPSAASGAGDRVADRMHRAANRLAPFTDFLTPMATVAGAVADEILQAIGRPDGLRCASVNNGGDIAIRIVAGEGLNVALASSRSVLLGELRLSSPGRRGVATSGWGGRSRSLGVADAVTVLAVDAALADAAATLIANAVNVDAPERIVRRPAVELDDDSDLGERPVTVAVGPLSREQCTIALETGLTLARTLHAQGLIEAAFITLQGRHRALPCGDSRIGWTNRVPSASINDDHRARLPPETHATGR